MTDRGTDAADSAAPAVAAAPGPTRRSMSARLVRAVFIELRRLGSDPALLAALALTVLPVVSAIDLVGDPKHLSSPGIIGALKDALSQMALVDGMIFAAGFAAVRTARHRSTGVLARDCVALGRMRPLAARALTSCIGGAAICAVVGAAVHTVGAVAVAAGPAVDAAAVSAGTPAAAIASAAVLGAAAGLWGAALGVLVPSPLIVLAAVAATLSPSLLLASAAASAATSVAAAARMLAAVSPLGSALTAAGHPLLPLADLESSGLPTGALADVVALAWLLVIAAVAAAVHSRRPVIG